MRDLVDLLAGRDGGLELDRAALLLATIEYPDLEIDSFVSLLDSHASELGERVPASADGPEFVTAANEYLFVELGFEGNVTDYYNPSNSCLNDVLTQRTGIPITLSVVYMEIARRLSRPVTGIGLPGHFIARYDDGVFSTFVDAFHGGRLLDVNDCFEMASSVTGEALPKDPGMLAPVSKAHIAGRMLNNLRGIYFQNRAYAKAAQVLDIILGAFPDSAAEYRQRAILHLRMSHLKGARSDLERYLELAPDAPDREDVEKQLVAIRRTFAGWN